MKKAQKEYENRYPATFKFETSVGVFFEKETIAGSDVFIEVLSGSGGESAVWGFTFEEILKNSCAGLSGSEREEAEAHMLNSMRKFLAERAGAR